ncbi:unnamed protein product [Penicillium salamii]|uniref:Uncharacterized protein n=1 Tax=Penicillium salamii TaxID=1612424 RepID=A0A9W4JG25_9EURO|nr:unnamed protein product [Penicillium salamii]CAG8394620.1 unnamed protein product [Penicillium salamii]CAG8396727.1 unnamed protein product [Penicillium salamii]CAG8396908.1 unnamed protein product [Penicillium salamii]
MMSGWHGYRTKSICGMLRRFRLHSKPPNISRIVLGLYIHDAELAKLHHHEPLLRHSLSRLPQISSNELFAASTANSWKTLMIRSHYQPPSPAHTNLCSSTPEFASLGMLESVSALASEEFTDVLQCHTLLTTWYTQYALVYKPASWLSLLILWHSIFMSLHVDFNILELTLGRDGDEASQKALPHAQKWIHSPDAKRCLLHAMLLQNHCESLPMGAESAIHLPLSLYHCGIIWAAFMCFSEQNSDAIIVDAADYLQFEELHLSGAGDLMNFGVLVPSRLALGSVFRVVGLLQRIGHWKISKSLASTLLGIVETREYL